MCFESVRWTTDHMTRLLDRLAGRRICVVWDLSDQESHVSDARRIYADWFVANHRKVNRAVLFLPEKPLIRMAPYVALSLVGAGKHAYSDYDESLQVARETVDYVRRNG